VGRIGHNAISGDTVLHLERIAGGRTAEVFAWEAGKIVTVYRPEFPWEAAQYEADIATQVQGLGVGCSSAITLRENTYGHTCLTASSCA